MNPYGRITSYGYPGDSTPDKNSSAAIGAWDNHLVDGLSLAVSPDIEEILKGLGCPHLGRLRLLLENGVILPVVWADRTANDHQAAALGLKPLRGRFDLYCKHTKSQFNDKKVVGIEVIHTPAHPAA